MVNRDAVNVFLSYFDKFRTDETVKYLFERKICPKSIDLGSEKIDELTFDEFKGVAELSFFESSLDSLYYLGDNLNKDSDELFYDIPSEDKRKVRTAFSVGMAISKDEDILFMRDTSFWSSRDQGLVITDWGVYIVRDNENVGDSNDWFGWIAVDHVEYKDEIFYFYVGDDVRELELSYFLKDKTELMDLVGYCQQLANMFSDMANTQIDTSDKEMEDSTDEYENEINALREKGDYDGAMEKIREYGQRYESCYFDNTYAEILSENLNRHEDAITFLEDSLRNRGADDTSDNFVSLWKAQICEFVIKNPECRRKHLKQLREYNHFACNYSQIPAIVDITRGWRSDVERITQEEFLNLDYADRKVIMPVKAYPESLGQKGVFVMHIDNLPKLSFPMGHPKANQLYVGHPLIPNKYIPFEDYEVELFHDKVRELCEILQRLGAMEISISCNNSKASAGDSSQTVRVGGRAENLAARGTAEATRQTGTKFSDRITQGLSLKQTFSPKNKPEIPSGLIWYGQEPSWQRLARQRMEGGLLTHEENVESQKTQQVDSNELLNLKLEVETIFNDFRLEVSRSLSSHFETHEQVVLSVNVRFAPLESLNGGVVEQKESANVASMRLTADEAEYMAEYKECIANGSVSDSERRLLTRLSAKLGISAERAEEIERMCAAVTVTDEEREYLEEYRACAGDGTVSAGERRLLDKIRTKLGISAERAEELERMA